MVRIIAGTLLDVGRGKIAPEEIPDILNAKDRSRAGVTAPALGLTMWQVLYDDFAEMS
jgi:tRNA pseudouridine38-40 synthase